MLRYRIEHIHLSDGVQHVVVGPDGGLAVLPCKFLKHLIATGKSTHTQKAYAYGLKEYANFLDLHELEYSDASMPVLMSFVQWLQDPLAESNVIRPKKRKPKRSPKTVNLYVSAVTSFYQYLYEAGFYDVDLRDQYLTTIDSKPKYKDFLYGIHSKEVKVSKLHVKEPRRRLRVLSNDQVEALLGATTNSRDRFLVYLLFVSGLRIGEALSLFNEDIVFDLKDGHRIQLRDRGALPNNAHLKSGERTVFVDQTCLDLFDDYQYDMLDRLDKDSDFVFVKLAGKNAGEPMDYNNVAALFRRLKSKTSIDVHAHLLRHTHGTRYFEETKDVKGLQERLGHAHLQTTMDIYVHPTDKEIRKDWEQAACAYEVRT